MITATEGYLLDTNICIYALRESGTSVGKHLQNHSPNDIYVPSIVRAELILEVEKSDRTDENRTTIEQFLMPLEIVPFGLEESEVYARLRARLKEDGSIIGPNDLIIAATAKASGLALVTNNKSEFQRVEGLEVVNWS